MTQNQIIFLVGYFIFFLLSSLAMLWWQKKRRGRRLPFRDDLRLLRSPGETQLKLVLKFEADMFIWIILSGGAPGLLALPLLLVARKFPAGFQLAALVAAGAIFIAAFIVSARWLAKKMQDNGNRYLGYFGERVVAEHLEPLKLQGWRIFHDMPCENGKSKFNIDHVAVGPGGVFAIETKTRRKGGAQPGRKDHEVWYDGMKLSWPLGEDGHGLEQAARNAQWLQNWIEKTIGEVLRVEPVLTFPGWMVVEKKRGAMRVVNPKFLPGVLTAKQDVLTEKQIALISLQLEQRCRDVEY